MWLMNEWIKVYRIARLQLQGLVWSANLERTSWTKHSGFSENIYVIMHYVSICVSSDTCTVILLCRTKELISVMYLTYARFSIGIQSISTDTRASVTAWSVAAGLITIRRYMQLQLRRGCVRKKYMLPEKTVKVPVSRKLGDFFEPPL